MDIEKVKYDSVGKWDSIYSYFGIHVGNGKHIPCPACAGKDRFRYDNKHGFGDYYCNGCGAGDGFSLLMKVLDITFIEAVKEVSKIVGTIDPVPYQKEKPIRPDALRKMYVESRPVIENDYVSLYLKTRGLKSIPSMLRCHTSCWEAETKKDQIAMLALFSAKDGSACTMHRTYLTENGTKLDVKVPKRTMPVVKPMSGGSVRLYQLEGDCLGICEGIETAIALHEDTGYPIWATLSNSNLEAFVPPKNIKELYIFGDNDMNFAGQKSAYKLANRLCLNGLECVVSIPIEVGADFLSERLRDNQ